MAPTTPQTRRVSQHGALIERLEAAWARTDAIFDLVLPWALYERPIALRHPLVFYVGHMPAFAWNLMMRGVLGCGDSDEPAYDRLFDFGIDPDEEDEEPTQPDWPALDTILRYRDHVREAVRSAGSRLEERPDGDVMAQDGRILHVVLEHELMHHETLLYMLHELDRARLRQASWWSDPVPGSDPVPRDAVRIPAGEVRLGADFGEIDFGWDNEFPARPAHVAAFELDVAPVTVGQWREFLDAGGYRNAALWDERALPWIARHDLAHPKDWKRENGRWFVRTMFHDVPLEDVTAWPVNVSWAEADAYARWKGRRLPAEAELNRAAYGSEDERRFPWGTKPPGPHHANLGFRHHSPTPVGHFPAGASAFGVQELVGSGWEWTGTPFARHAGFESYMKGYRGYSADFFDGAHYVLFGGSWATDATLARRSFRNWFRFNYPFPFTKFRLARSA